MKDISKLFETIMDFKGLSCLVTEKSLIKNQRPVFSFAIVTCLGKSIFNNSDYFDIGFSIPIVAGFNCICIFNFFKADWNEEIV